MIDFTDGTWVRDYSDVNRRRQVCGCGWVYVYRTGWMRTVHCDEHKEAS